MPLRDIIGHDQLRSLLSRAVSRDTLPPSLIFAGSAGVGKATTAVALAQLLNCEQLAADPGLPDGGDACGTCRGCRLIQRAAAAFAAGDRPAIDCLQWLAPDEKASIKIDPVRDVLARAGYRPFDGRRRVVVIDDAHMLEVAAQQALLKMLEEPPPATRFVLVTSQPDMLLPTIRSRCPQFRFGPVAATAIVQALVQRHGWTTEDAQAAAAVADGRFGSALRRGDAAMLQTRALAAEVLDQVAGSRSPRQRLAASQTLIVKVDSPKTKGPDAKGRSDAVRNRGANATRQEISARLNAMAALLRDIGVLTSKADHRRLANVDLLSQLDRMSRVFTGERLTRAFSVVDQARAALERNASHKLVADWLALHL